MEEYLRGRIMYLGQSLDGDPDNLKLQGMFQEAEQALEWCQVLADQW